MATIDFTVKWQGDIAKLVAAAGAKAPYAVARAVDEVGNKAATQVKRATARQAGVPYGQVNGVMTVRQAMGMGGGQWSMTARDVTLSLKQFSARPTRRGVSAAPWKRRLVFPGTFIGPNGHVYSNTRALNKVSGRNNAIEKKWGPNIPKEMVKDASEQVFYQITMQLLPFTLEKWLLRS